MICFPLAGAIATLVGQALGAGNVPRAWRAMGLGILVHGTLMWALALFFYLFRFEVLAFFTSDPDVIEIGARLLVWQSASYVFLAFYFVFFRALQGAGAAELEEIVVDADPLHRQDLGPHGGQGSRNLARRRCTVQPPRGCSETRVCPSADKGRSRRIDRPESSANLPRRRPRVLEWWH